MFVVDTSVWIDFFRGRATSETASLKSALRNIRNVALCGPVLQEVLQGVRDDRDFKKERLKLSKFAFLEATRWTFLRAAALYRVLRRKGHTLGPFDTLIGAVCLEHGVPLLTADRRDFEPLVRHAGLRLA